MLSALEIFKLRARWCSLFPSVIEYREGISKLLCDNDRENTLLNSTLQKWNKRIDEIGLPVFESNDLRGVNLGGLELGQSSFNGIWLRNVDMKYSELSLVQLDGANLYQANLLGSNGMHSSFMQTILNGANLSNSFLSHARFEESDLSNTNFNNSICYNSQFDGAILKGASLCGSMLGNVSLLPSITIDKGIEKRKPTDMREVIWDKDTDLSDAKIDSESTLISVDFRTFVYGKNKNTNSPIRRIFGALELKPGMFGLGVDIKKLFRKRS